MTEVLDIAIGDAIFQSWEGIAVPDMDVFFFSSLTELGELLPGEAFVLPIEEFNQHNIYKFIDIINSYQLWNLSKEARYVCVASREWFPKIDRSNRQVILEKQKQLNRGAIYDWGLFEPVFQQLLQTEQETIWSMIEPYMIHVGQKVYVAFQKDMWVNLPTPFKRAILRQMAEQFLDPVKEFNQLGVEQFPNIKEYFNQFSAINGPNCFAATLAAATKDKQLCKWIINQWVHPDTLLLGLEMRGYQEVNASLMNLKSEDIVLWFDQNQNMIHASFYLGDDCFFNKNGQIFLNSWQVVGKETLIKNWGNENIKIYRR